METHQGTRPYQVRLAGLTQLQAALEALGVPVQIQENMPQMASSFVHDHWQPVLWAGDDQHGYKSVKFLHGIDGWYYAVDSWMNNRGNDVTQVAGELLLWWCESGPARM